MLKPFAGNGASAPHTVIWPVRPASNEVTFAEAE